MKKLLLVTALFALLISFSFAQKPYKVVFYNLENFFDTINDPEVHDDEFTPKDLRSGTQPSTIRSWLTQNVYSSILQLSTRIIR